MNVKGARLLVISAGKVTTLKGRTVLLKKGKRSVVFFQKMTFVKILLHNEVVARKNDLI